MWSREASSGTTPVRVVQRHLRCSAWASSRHRVVTATPVSSQESRS